MSLPVVWVKVEVAWAVTPSIGAFWRVATLMGALEQGFPEREAVILQRQCAGEQQSATVASLEQLPVSIPQDGMEI